MAVSLSSVASFVKAALDFAVNNAGRTAATIAVAAPALHVNLNNAEANALAEVILVAVFLFEEFGNLVASMAAAKK